MRNSVLVFWASAAFLMTTGCPGTSKDIDDLLDTGEELADLDNDGFNVEDDCDDLENAINPDADEICDGIDNNCDDVVDEDAIDLIEFYADGDGDGFGDAATSESACEASSGFVEDATDCDDTNVDVNPDVDEVCNEIDDNCDGTVDEDTATDALLWYADVDLDGFGDAATETPACSQPTDMIADDTDCDDAVATTYPGADEVCNGADDNCDGFVDEDTAVDALTWYADSDSDTYGDAAVTHVSCAAPSGYVADDTDCNDTETGVNPGADELCSTVGVDDDCDGEIDENTATDALTFYTDGDGDTYGDASNSWLSCEAMPNSTDAGSRSVTASILDGNTTVDALSLAGCGTVAALTVDIDITHTYQGDLIIDLTNPGGTTVRLWDGAGGSAHNIQGTFTDDGTDLVPAESLSGFASQDSAGTWELSIFDQGTGDTGTLHAWGVNVDCGGGTVADDTDCDDTSASVNPGALEYCNGIDDNCDAVTDEDPAADAQVWYDDSDNDGYGDPAQPSVTTCYASGTHTADNMDDCNDSEATTNPGADEYCNGVDDDCDNFTDENTAIDASTWYVDSDGDGYGDLNGTGLVQCEDPSVANSVQHTLTATSTGYDRDSFARGNILDASADATVTEFSMSLDSGDCTALDFFVLDQSDGSVVDSNLAVSVASSTTDNFSSGTLNAQLTSGESYALVVGWSGCSLTYFEASEAPGTVVSGLGTWDDGWADNTYDGVLPQDLASGVGYLYQQSVTVLSTGAGYSADNTDCDDGSDSVNTAATELCNSIDDNCSGSADDATASFLDTNGTWSDATDLTGGTAASPASTSISEDGTLYFCPGTHYVSIVSDTATVSIEGITSTASDTVLDGGATDQVLGVGSLGDVSVSDLTIQNGETGSSGANINCAVSGSTLALDNVVVTGGNAGLFGGGIYASDCEIELVDAVISNNTASKGGGLYVTNAGLDTYQTEISGNTATQGGGFRLYGDDGGYYTVSIEDTWVINNTATGTITNKGGGVAIQTLSDTDYYLDCETSSGTSGFYGNTAATGSGGAAGLGGAVYLDGSSSGSGSESDFDTESSNCFMGDSGSSDDNSPDDVYVEDEGVAYFMGDGSAEGGRSFDCDSSGATNGCDFRDLSSDLQGKAGVDATSSLTLQGADYSFSDRARGNLITVSQDLTLGEFSMYLDSGDCTTFDFFVLDDSGTVVDSNTGVSVSSNTTGDFSSGTLSADLTSGETYALVVGWYGCESHFYEASESLGNSIAGVGTWDNGWFDNSYDGVLPVGAPNTGNYLYVQSVSLTNLLGYDATAGNTLLGNIIQADDDYEIESFSMYLDLGSSCDVDFYVYESAVGGSSMSDWTMIASSLISYSTNPSEGWIESGYIGDATLVAGNYYGFAVGWDCLDATTYYWDIGTTATDLGSGAPGYFVVTNGNWVSDTPSLISIGGDYQMPIDVEYN